MNVLAPIIGHRGAGSLAPENTVSALRAAAAIGLTSVEFDVRATADEHYVLMHDEDVARTTSGQGSVESLLLGEVRALDAGGWFGASHRGEPVPTLSEAAACLSRLGLTANVEIKAGVTSAHRTGAGVALWIAQNWPRTPALPLVSSFDEAVLAGARAAVPGLSFALVVHAIPPDWSTRLARLGCSSLHCAAVGLSERQVDEVCRSGVALRVYTVNGASAAERLFSLGVAGVFTDRPDRLLKRAPLGR